VTVGRARLVIVGGDAGGMTAAAQARRRSRAEELEIVAFERGDYTSYSACGLPYLVADEIGDAGRLVARSPQQHRANGVEVHTRHEVTGIDLDARTVTVVDRERAQERREPFDQLVVGTGANPIRPPLPGVDARGVHGIQTITDGIDLRSHVGEHRHANQRAVVVGGGYIGLEMAEALHKRGLPVTIVEAAPHVMSTLDPDMATLVETAIRSVGIDLRVETQVQGFEADGDGHVRGVVTADGTLPADVVVLGIGVRPNSALAEEAGLAIGATGGIVTDRRMATSAEGVWAAGDCVESFHRVSRRAVSIALGTHANKQGRIAGINATGGYATFLGVIGTAVTKICDYEIGRTGLSEREAKQAGFGSVTATIESSTRAHYYPGSSTITVKVVAEQRTGRILGAQIIGQEGAAKRVDVMAAAIWNEMTVDEFAQLDLGYAPPFSPVWDPTLVAARRAAESLT
jgi:NADPH-dependent 2,4-dienoyl-CoA reductase/sulfur reductase-like enzyme